MWWFSPAPDRQRPSAWPAFVRVLAGDGVSGFADGAADRARFSDPFGVAVDAAGLIYVADAGDAQRIRVIAPNGLVSTRAGGERGFADGQGGAAKFNTPSGIAVDAQGVLYVADTGNNAIRRITADGHVTTMAGDGIAGHEDGAAAEARFNGPVGVAVDLSGRVIVADTYNDRIRAISHDGQVTTLAGSGQPGWVDGPASEAQFDTPCGVAIDARGTIYVADSGNGLLRTLAPDGSVGTLTLTGSAFISRPMGLAFSAAGDLYVADERGQILEITSASITRSLAGSTTGFRDGPGIEAQFRRPTGIAVAGPGRLIVADSGNTLIRDVAAAAAPDSGEARLPASPRIAPHFDAAAFRWQPLLWPVAPMDGPHEIAGTLGEARGSDGADRLHAGIDVRIEQGTPVRAIRSSAVTSPMATSDFGSLNEWLRIGPINYVHIRAGRTIRNYVTDLARFAPSYDGTRLVRVRAKRGAYFRTGEVIGSVNAFNHVHINVGWPGEEYNPLHFSLVQFSDSVAPSIARGGIRVFDEQAQPLTRRVNGRLVVSGRVQIVVDAWDQADGNRPNRRLGVHELGYEVLHRDGTPSPTFGSRRDTMRFDRMNLEPGAPRLIYAPGSGIPFYRGGATRFLYIVTNHFRGGIASADMWDTTVLPPGDYTLRVRVADISGNEALANRDLPITIESAETVQNR